MLHYDADFIGCLSEESSLSLAPVVIIILKMEGYRFMINTFTWLELDVCKSVKAVDLLLGTLMFLHDAHDTCLRCSSASIIKISSISNFYIP